jgi:glycosyltransferase involved in cell wall biosynthesis
VKVLFVNPGGDAAGGAERSLALLMTGLSDRGHDLAAVTLMEGDAVDAFRSAGAAILANGVGEGLSQVRRHGSSGAFLWGSLESVPEAVSTVAMLRGLASSFEADVIHTNGLRAHVLTPLLTRGNHRVVWTLRERPPGELRRWLTRGAARFAAAVVAPSNFAAELVSRSRRPVYVIPNPVETPAPVDGQGCRRVLGLPLDRPIAGVIAHLHPTKGHHVAVAAWEELDEPRPLLVLAGGDLYGQASIDYRRSLEAHIVERGLDRDVMLPGLVGDMANFYRACDLVVHPALYPEGFGRSIAEAQSAGVPVVATALGGPLELIEDGVSGILVRPGDAAGLAHEVARLLRDSVVYSRLRAGGLVAGERYGVRAHAVAVESVYRAVSR